MLNTVAKTFTAIDPWLEWLGDRLNPLLVKETRQALKSRQFTLWFVLMLIASWLITIGGVAIIGPSISFVSAGGYLLLAYFFALAVPLVIVVPFTAYRSLAAELEDNTRDLLEVSTLSPYQIINGKLGSAVVQMLVYLSVLAPCLAFTYLLRGVDLPTIALLLSMAVSTSLALSLIGLLFAAVTRQRYAQVVLSIILAGALFLALWGLLTSAWAITNYGAWFADDETKVVIAAISSAFVTSFALLYLTAVKLVTFASANRSTALRWAMVVQQAVFLAWIGGLIAQAKGTGVNRAAIITGIFCGVYWLVMGSLLTGESPTLSRRVRRDLPQSTVGQMLFGLFNPGPGSGYLFVLANLLTVAVLFMFGLASNGGILNSNVVGPGPSNQTAAVFLLLGLSYVAIYLGLGKLLIAAARKVAVVTMLGSFLIHVLLVLACCGVPVLLQQSISWLRSPNYTYLQLPNAAWTLSDLLDDDLTSMQWLTAVLIVPAVAACVFLVNLLIAAREAEQQRVAAPERVVQDDLELAPPPELKPQNPWEEPEPA
jgi:hypothetical protein